MSVVDSESDSDELKPRSSREVAERSLALLAVIDHAHAVMERADRVHVPEEDYPALPTLFRVALSTSEVAFLDTPQPSEHECVQFAWRAEALVSLLWALGHVSSLYPLNQQVNLKAIPVIEAALLSPEAFIESAALRALNELEQAEHDLYHQHWRVRDARLFNKPMPEELDPEIVYERRYGLSWILGWGDDWDEVPTDT